jgi:hypothetical protein
MKFMLVVCFFYSIFSFAQDFQSDPMSLEGQGQLLSVRIVLGEKHAKVYLIGKEAVKLSFEKDARLLQLTAFDNENATEELQFVPGKGYYTVKKLPAWANKIDSFKVKAKVKDQTENIEVKRRN